MPHPSKAKGNGFERELVNQAIKAGCEAQRAWGSNGEALGENAEVDLKVDDMRIQAKRRKALPSYLQVPEGCEAVVFRQDRGETLVLLRWPELLTMLTTNKP